LRANERVLQLDFGAIAMVQQLGFGVFARK
jgi:hypothetical protein